MMERIVSEINRKADSELRAEREKLDKAIDEFFKSNSTFVIKGGWWELKKAVHDYLQKDWNEYKKRRVEKIIDRITKQGEIK